ncbi:MULTISPECIES: aldehyde dehydrogenase family protein [unclassified Acinetobacter]|uniref:aldehyde dehydrogenase family protein n=1 Tax=unclassified Acinetobacter TaxID=196816 RepID=UPI002574F92A|nr:MULTISPECIES: aldehyde dehydrogenase family protein [unclassified Acinetobacter]MDM1757714.1 aldehyde dehydrogenase family protein [Acinetobacter sp. 256-1]MDM1762141.1 aldehyde dehydrogenase family protein [Acinetobacter sp. 251-1]
MNTALIIDGQKIQGEGATFAVINPANETVLTDVASASLKQVNDAIESAAQAFKTWKNTEDQVIHALFHKIAADIRAEKDEIAQLITLEQGKTLAMAQFEVEAGAGWIEYLTSLDIPVETMTEPNGKTIKVYNRPLGVVASITPWNWPFMIAVWHIFPALKTKNCVVNKPSEYTPLSTIKLVEIINRHLPQGACNIILGQGEVGQALSEHAAVDKVTFTGSTRTGQSILSHSVRSLKSVVLELGGNDAGIVLEDADIEMVAEKIFGSAFLNAGQTCAALKRLYVHENIYDALVKKLVEIANQQVIGDGTDAAVSFGPVQNKMQYDKVKALIQDAVAQGGTVVSTAQALPETGYFIAPTIVTNVHEGMALVDQEQFGPVLPVLKFRTIDEVLQRSNATEFGLGGSVWSQNLELAENIASQMETGTVWINSHSDLSPAAVFGGWKLSGLGYSFGLDGLLLFTHKQAVHITS